MRKLLAIGIDEYDFDLSPLEGCAADAQAFADLMQKNQDGSGNFQVAVEKNVPTKAALTRLIRNFFRGDATTAVLYFSGHGIINENGSYIVAPDYQDDDEGVSMESILQIVNRSRFQDKIIILDCCHSGAFGSPMSTGGMLATISKGTVILTASNSDESAYQENGRGVFTKLLIEALSGGAADLGGGVTPGSVYAYVDRALGPFDSQRPIFKTNVSRFTLLRKVIPQVAPEVLEQLIGFFPTADHVYPLDPSYEETNYKGSEHHHIKPFRKKDNIKKFKMMQQYQSVGLVVPDKAEFMYWAAMKSTGCKLTVLGQQYWQLIKESKFYYLT